ncbi:MAG: phosphoenolpyruvate--protein phosphotransferase [Candidatus Goldiibacteriota bacterium HGW-Goldbacteria-1]|jgi:phosphotransferase system enzyme I (PtsI)|nr:MAG: phosphoenolpyruvate--protein phosphotransferase [Candidatus Goldiibacteriota bacterium HGW-Goldbacteria-1]
MYKGIPASPGIVIGQAYVINKKSAEITKRIIVPALVEAEIQRLRKAVEKTKIDIMSIKEKVIYDIGNSEADIFNAYLMLLEDRMFAGKSETIIKTESVNAEYALMQVLKEYAEFFNKISDSYLKERGRDISGLVEKIIKNLAELKTKDGDAPADKYIVVAHDLTPADTAEMDKGKVMGFVTEIGGATSHTAIVARSLEIPAVVGVRDITATLNTGDILILDGEKGIVAVNPGAKVMNAYREEQKKYTLKLRMLKRLKTLEAVTVDKHKVELNANIEFPEEIGAVLENNADGVGLFRTEFIYMNKMNLPSEEEQFESYKTVITKMGNKSVTIRTMDIGGDKFLPYFKIMPEQNPFLGLRAIRLSLANQNIFRLQLRAILRASAFGKARIMFPMVSVIEEIEEAKKILEEVKFDLKSKKVVYDEQIKVGTMIEVPSAVLMSAEIAKHVDFFSIGTNDLIQYTVAVDRGNEAVAHLYDGLNPAVLRSIKMTVDSAHKNGIKVSVCGEMAGQPYMAFILIGLGVDELSGNSASILSVKKMIRSIKFQSALETADAALKMEKASDIKSFLTAKVNQLLYETEKGA